MCSNPSLQEAIKLDRTNPFRETEEEYDAERGESAKNGFGAASGGSKSVASLRWWLSLLHAVNRQFRFVKVKTATRPEIRSTFLTPLFLRKESSVVIFYGPF